MTSGVAGPACPQEGITQGAAVDELSEARETEHQKTGQSTLNRAQETATDGEGPALRPHTALHSGGDKLVTVAALDLGRLLSKHLFRVHCNWD